MTADLIERDTRVTTRELGICSQLTSFKIRRRSTDSLGRSVYTLGRSIASSPKKRKLL